MIEYPIRTILRALTDLRILKYDDRLGSINYDNDLVKIKSLCWLKLIEGCSIYLLCMLAY